MAFSAEWRKRGEEAIILKTQKIPKEMIYREEPEQFNPKFEVVSCFVEHAGEFLLLHRVNHKPEGNKWGVPAGKIEQGEDIFDAIQREIREETGYQREKSQMSYFQKAYVKYPTHDFIYQMFHTRVDKKNEVMLNPKEHDAYSWFSPQKALELKLVRDLDACIKLCYTM